MTTTDRRLPTVLINPSVMPGVVRVADMPNGELPELYDQGTCPSCDDELGVLRGTVAASCPTCFHPFRVKEALVTRTSRVRVVGA